MPSTKWILIKSSVYKTCQNNTTLIYYSTAPSNIFSFSIDLSIQYEFGIESKGERLVLHPILPELWSRILQNVYGVFYCVYFVHEQGKYHNRWTSWNHRQSNLNKRYKLTTNRAIPFCFRNWASVVLSLCLTGFFINADPELRWYIQSP